MSKFSVKELDQDTIAAIATATGEGGVGIVRLSGPQAITIADKIFRGSGKKRAADQKAYTAQHGKIENNGKIIDEVLLLVMRAPRSYTCEDVVEIQAHGSAASLGRILDLCVANGARLAAKGEFTKRAFLNGRMDLTQAEAVLDLVKAKTEKNREWASAQLEGSLSKEIQAIRTELVDILSHLEASIDFPDDFPDTQSARLLQERLRSQADKVRALLASASLGLLAKKGIRAAIIGRPNAGKSSLLNRLSGENRVIVTEIAGTTRDVVEHELDLKGFCLRLLDTAGIQESSNRIEKEGIARSKKAAEEADLILYVVDGSEALEPEEEVLFQSLLGLKKPLLLILNKKDKGQKLSAASFKSMPKNGQAVCISCLNGEGMPALEAQLLKIIQNGVPVEDSGLPVITSVRQKDLLQKTLEAVGQALAIPAPESSPELVAVDVRQALDCLGSLVGEIVTDDLLDVIFNQFCIGK